jgi:hypothetical protein
MKKTQFFLLLFIGILLLKSSDSYSQSVYEPVYNTDIYNFLDRLSEKGIIKLFDDIRPVTRLKITEKLLQASGQSNKLSEIEKERLGFYKKEYAFEIKYIEKDTSEISEFFSSGSGSRFNLYKYYSPGFTFTADPVIGAGYNFSEKTYHQYGGIQFYGRINDNWGFYFNYRDNLEHGDNIDREKSFSPATGVIISKSGEKKIEYSETRGGLTLGWQWGEFTMAKDFINIGSSYQSQVILSSKAPSFPFIRLDIHPVKWFRYNFIHAWLNSDLIDSSTVRYTGVTSTFEDRSKTFSKRQKYYVGHSISFQPFDNWWLTLGESIIYSDKMEFIYFLPVFYRLADHYNSFGGGDSGDNAQIFFNTSYRWQKIKSKFYLSLYIDELSPESLFSGGNNAQVYAVTLGGKFTNPLWDDNYLTLEYSALKPYNYMNGDPAQTYFSSGYQLGHWIGSNAVQIYAEMEQYLPYLINLKAYFNYIIKGEKENINDYYDRVTSTYPLLAGDNSYYSDIGAEISYNPLNDLYFILKFGYINKASGRFESEYNIDEDFSFVTFVRYGF